MKILYKLTRPILFRIDAENAHYKVMNTLKNSCKIPFAKSILKTWHQLENPDLERKVFGLNFKNPVGLAAGFDKDARWLDELACFGFGFIEIGTLTPKAQAGNPKPRLFRLPKDNALINRLGFNNGGVDDAVKRLQNRPPNLIVGGNIGKNKDTPNEQAVQDYLICFEKLFDVVDYFTVNVSSPNTPNLRALQEKEPLKDLLSTLQKYNLQKAKPKPILLKIAPDLNENQLDDILDIVTTTQLDGVIATNTTIDRQGLLTENDTVQQIGNGGLSGKPLRQKSTQVISYLYQNSGKKLNIIGVGGIMSPEDAIEKLEAGAKLIQIYTGFIYNGSTFVKEINQRLLKNQ